MNWEGGIHNIKWKVRHNIGCKKQNPVNGQFKKKTHSFIYSQKLYIL